MKELEFGLTMTGLGMGVTFATLWLLSLLISLLARLFPYKETKEEGKTEG